MSQFKKTEHNTVKRTSNRGAYDRKTIYNILDAGYVCHVGFSMQNRPFVIPMAYGRKGDMLYLHGSVKSRLQQELSGGVDCCISVTHLDGLVLARSAFDHSMNYRSVVLFGNAKPVDDNEQKRMALKAVSDHLMPGRWEEVREPTEKELRATAIAAVQIKEASAKIRTGPPQDNRKDLDLPVWAGVIPFEMAAGKPVADPQLKEGIKPGPSVTEFKIRR